MAMWRVATSIVLIACGPRAHEVPARKAAAQLVARGTCGAPCVHSWPLPAHDADSRAAIQAGLDWLTANGGGELRIPAGSFEISGPGLRITGSRIALLGEGKHATTLAQRAPSDVGLVAVGDAAQLHAIEIADLTLVGHGTVLGDYDRREINNVGIRFTGETFNVHIHDVAISGFGVGVAPWYSADAKPTMHGARFERCELHGLAPTDLRMHAGIVLNADDAVVEHNVVTGFSYGINPSYYSRGTRVAHNRVVLSRGAGVGIYLASASGSSCDHNEIEIELPNSLIGYRSDGCIKIGAVMSPASRGFAVRNNSCTNGSIKIANAYDGVIQRNTITGAVSSGIYLDPYVDAEHPRPNGENILIEHNTITGARGSGVYFPVADHVIVRDNHIAGCGVAGVFLQRAKNASIVGNSISDCALQAIYLDGAAATSVWGNTISRRERCRTVAASCPAAVLVRGSGPSVTIKGNKSVGYARDLVVQSPQLSD